MSTAVPAGYQSQVDAAETQNGIPSGLLADVLGQESGWNPNAINASSGATGLAQVLPSTAANPGYGVTPLSNPYDSSSSISFAGQYLRALFQKTGSWQGAVQAYGTVPSSGGLTAGQQSVLAAAQAADAGQGTDTSGASGTGSTGDGSGLSASQFASILGSAGAGLDTGVTSGQMYGATSGTGAGYPVDVGLEPGTGGLIGGVTGYIGDQIHAATSGILSTATSLASRFGLVLLGVVLIGGAIAWMIAGNKVRDIVGEGG